MTKSIGILLTNTRCPTLYQLLEGIYLVQRPLGEIQIEDDGLLDNTPEADMMQVGGLHDLSHRCITDATCRIVDDTTQSLLIIGIRHHTEVGNDILDFLALVETQTTIDTIWDTILSHLFLKGAALGVGTIENGKIVVLCLVLSTDSLDIVTHNDSLFPVTIGRLQGQSLTLLVLTEHILVYLSLVLAYQTIGCLYDELCRTVVLLQFKETRTLILLLEIEDVIDIGTTETVDALCIVSHHTDTSVLAGQLQDNLLLSVVRILILIDQHIAETLHIFLTDVLMVLKQ